LGGERVFVAAMLVQRSQHRAGARDDDEDHSATRCRLASNIARNIKKIEALTVAQ
jgi:hypothetical protein